MIDIIIYNIIIVIINYFIILNKKYGSDHSIHVNLINRIKHNKYKFVDSGILSYNESYPHYPQLYHWLLSFLPEKVYKEKHIYINLTIKAIELISFNLFLFYLQSIICFDEINILYANIVFNIFPFTYAVWNAKNVGLSARHIGLIFGQIFLYLLFTYILENSIFSYFLLIFNVLIIYLLSLFTIQFALLSLILLSITFGTYEILFIPFISFVLFFIVSPKYAINNLKGQYFYRRNYALFLSDIFILKERPSIYRDFVYDFWVKFKSGLKNGIVYMGMNPLVEIIYGFPFLWFVLYYSYDYQIGDIENILLKILLITLGLFFLTSFRKTRFLGEPQRYLEFAIPFISILFVLHFGLEYLIIIGSFSLMLIILMNIMSKNENKSKIKNDLLLFLNEIKNIVKENDICISNDSELLRKTISNNLIIFPDYTYNYGSKDEYQIQFERDYGIVSRKFISDNIIKFNINYLIINDSFYKKDIIDINKKINLVFELGHYKLYKLI